MYNDFQRAQSVERQVELSLKLKNRSKKTRFGHPAELASNYLRVRRILRNVPGD